MVCADCLDNVGRKPLHTAECPPVLQKMADTSNEGPEFRFTPSMSGPGRCDERTYKVLPHATAKLLAFELLREAYLFPSCASVRMCLTYGSDAACDIFRGPPLFLDQNRLESTLVRTYQQRGIHPRTSEISITVTSLTRASGSVRFIQKSEFYPGSLMEVEDLPLSKEAKDVASQVQCWYPAIRNVVLGRHYLAGMLAAHLFSDIKIFLDRFPDYSQEFSQMFINGSNGTRFEQFIYCRKASWLFRNPELVLITSSARVGHTHRLRCRIAGTEGSVIDGSVFVEKLPLEVIRKLPFQHVMRPVVSVGNNRPQFSTCAVIQKRRTSFNLTLLMCAARLVGKMSIASKRFIRRTYMPGSALFHQVKSQYPDAPIQKFWYFGYEDLQRSKRQTYRKMKIRFAKRVLANKFTA